MLLPFSIAAALAMGLETYRPIPHTNFLISAGGNHPASLFVNHYIPNKIIVLQHEIWLPVVVSHKTFCGSVSGSGPEISIVVEEKLVDTGIMGQQRVRVSEILAASGNVEASNLTIASRTKYNHFLALWVQRGRINR
jgi:hypothetical protein